jgi:predicted O-linked N-acetylglucosamine transferase (SPINDLY family)
MRPGDTRLRGNHLLFLLSAPGLTPEHLSAVAREHGAAIESAAGPWVRMGYQRKAENVSRRLRVGFLSPDFRVHSVMNFVEPLLARLDRTQFDVWSLYLMHQEDQVTARARQLSDHFVSLAGLSHDEKVRKLRSLELDIVIDLAGHSANNGLTLLAAQVAPVQASWGGFPSTTGMQSIQYRLTDHVTDPPDAENWYTEKLYRMKGLVCCYRPMIRRPLLRYQEKYYVQPSPALQNGFVTFGSCNNLSKLTDDVLKVWSRILRRVAGSKLLIEGKDLGKPEFASKFTARCKKTGIPEDSLVLVGLDPANQYLTYHRIDIALDPFPLTGGTTSFDALWMGVPLVTLEGEMFSSRMGTGLLTTIGRPEWISQTAEQYIEIAAELATDAVQLNDIRMTVRDSIERSPAMDEQLFAREFGEGLHHMWQAWVQSGQAPLLAAPVELPAAACEHAAAQHTLSGTSPIQVATSRGTRTCTSQAYVELQEGLAQAKAATPSELPLRDDMLMPEWRTVAEEAKLLMATLPGDPMALAVLAEVEMAHGNAAAAEHYMAWAVRHLAQQEGIR